MYTQLREVPDTGINKEAQDPFWGQDFFRDLVFGELPQHWAQGQLQFLAITWFPGSSEQGEEQGPD